MAAESFQLCSEVMSLGSSQQNCFPLCGMEPSMVTMCNYEVPHTNLHTELGNGLSMFPEGCDPALWYEDPDQKRTAIDYVDTKAMIPPHELVPLPIEITGQEPFLVNVKRFHRILQRRHDRAQLLAKTECKTLRTGKRYFHESRHQHALRRERGPKGRFVTKSKGETASTKD